MYKPKVYILAGGLGTRIASINTKLPKCLMKVSGKPFLDWLLSWLKSYDLVDIVLMVGHLKNQIMDYYGDGHHLGLKISYSQEDSLLGTGGAFIKAINEFPSDHFILINGDTYFPVNLKWLYDWQKKIPTGTITLCLKYLSKTDRYGSVELDSKFMISRFNEKDISLTDGYINGGVYLGSTELLINYPIKTMSIERDIFPNLVKHKRLYGMPFSDKFIDIGIPNDYHKADQLLAKWMNEIKQPALFLDRDGVIIKDKDHNNNPQDFELYRDTLIFLKSLNLDRRLLFIMTNQSAIAKGISSETEVITANHYLTNELKKEGINVIKIYWCPYHPQALIAKYHQNSLLRKPLPGMFLLAADEGNLDLYHSVMLGDKDTDIINLPYLQSFLIQRNYPIKKKHAIKSFNQLMKIIK